MFWQNSAKSHVNLIWINWKIQVFGDITKVSQNRGIFNLKFKHSQSFFLDCSSVLSPVLTTEVCYRDRIKLEKRKKPSNPGYVQTSQNNRRFYSFYRSIAQTFKCYLLTDCRCEDKTEPHNVDSSKWRLYFITDDEVKSHGMTYLEEITIVLIKGRMFRLVHRRYHRFYNCNWYRLLSAHLVRIVDNWIKLYHILW